MVNPIAVLITAIAPPNVADPVARNPTSVIAHRPMIFQIIAFTSERVRVSILPPEYVMPQVYCDTALCRIP